MAISDKTRKLIWGRSGNQCAYCRHELLMDATSSDAAAVVGEECHIIGPKEGSLRYDPTYPAEHLDRCENLVLLCRTHHKMVDDQTVEFSADALRKLKTRHEQRVRAALRADPAQDSVTHILLPRVRTGRELLQAVLGVFSYDFDHDDPRSSAEAELLGAFLQTAHDWGEVGDDLEPGRRVEVGHDLTVNIKRLEAAGFVVLAKKADQRVQTGGETEMWPVAIVRLLRADNPVFHQT